MFEPQSDPRQQRPSLREEAIARRAYALWELRGRPAGEALAHWLAAEAEFRAADRESVTPPRDVDDDTPITLEDFEGVAGERTAHGGQLPPPHRR